MNIQTNRILLNSWMLIVVCLMFSNCQDDPFISIPTAKSESSSKKDGKYELSRARIYYLQHQQEATATRSADPERSKFAYIPYANGDPSWRIYTFFQNDSLLSVDVDMTDRIRQDYYLKENLEAYQKSKDNDYLRSYTRYVYTFNRKTNEERAFYMTVVPTADFVEKYNKRIRSVTYLKRDKDLSAYILYHELDGTFINGWEYKQGKITNKILPRYKVAGMESASLLLLGKRDASYEVSLKMENRTRSFGYDTGEGWDIDGGQFPDVVINGNYPSEPDWWVSSGPNIPEDIDFPEHNNNIQGDPNDPYLTEYDSIGGGGEYVSGGNGSGPVDPPKEEKPEEEVSKEPVELRDKKKFVGYDGSECLELAKRTLKNYGITNYGSSANVFRLVEEKDGKLVKWGAFPYQNYENAIKCIDKHLNANRPIIVGVDYLPKQDVNEGTTDHFVVITGRGFDSDAGKYYYTFMDNATSYADKGCSDTNRFYYTEGNNLSGKSVLIQDKDVTYTVSQVRPNDGQKYETTTAYK